MADRTIYLADYGQAFMEFDIDANGVVVGCRPAQDWLWLGVTVVNHAVLVVGMVPVVRRTSGAAATLLRCPVEFISDSAVAA